MLYTCINYSSSRRTYLICNSDSVYASSNSFLDCLQSTRRRKKSLEASYLHVDLLKRFLAISVEIKEWIFIRFFNYEELKKSVEYNVMGPSVSA